MGAKMDFNEELYGIYHELDQEIYKIIVEKNTQIENEANKAAYPLFIRTTKEYDEADVKIMIFGKETNGWGKGVYGNDDKKYVDDIINDYDDFFNTKYCYQYGGQFWNMVKYVIECLKSKNKNKKIEYLWNNLVKMGKNGKGFPYIWYNDVIKPYFNEVILKEITILKPDFIIFFTGPNSTNGPYDTVLNEVFNNPHRKPIEGFVEDELCEIEIPCVKKAFRTYHPTFLLHNNKNRSYKEYMQKIIDEIINKM
jgi:hypothetical protein